MRSDLAFHGVTVLRYTVRMSKESLVFFVGLVVFVTSFLGIPNDWKEAVFVVTGILLMFVGYLLRRGAFLRSIDVGNGERRSDAFEESIGKREGEEVLKGN